MICGFSFLKMPGEKLCLTTKNGKICLRVLRNKLHQLRGFQLVEKIAPNEGLIYVVTPFAKKPSFWMKDVLQPLDIVFLSNAGHVLEVVKALPYQRKIIKSPKNTSFAIELPAGEAKRLKLCKGCKVLAPFLVNL